MKWFYETSLFTGEHWQGVGLANGNNKLDGEGSGRSAGYAGGTSHGRGHGNANGASHEGRGACCLSARMTADAFYGHGWAEGDGD